MSFSIHFNNAGPVQPFLYGSNLMAELDSNGRLVPKANTYPQMDITYNYSKFYREHLDKEQGLRWLYGKTGRETQDRLFKAISILGIKRSEDYWDDTEGNAGFALMILLSWALQYPEGVWDGD